MMGHNAFNMILLPLIIWMTLTLIALAVVQVLFSLILRLAQRFSKPATKVRPATDGERVPSFSPHAPASRSGAFRHAERIERSTRTHSLRVAGTTIAQEALVP
jgi:hypothetical protein